jgi:hypothetical protein
VEYFSELPCVNGSGDRTQSLDERLRFHKRLNGLRRTKLLPSQPE